MLPEPVVILPDFASGSPNLITGTAPIFRTEGSSVVRRFVADTNWVYGTWPTWMKEAHSIVGSGIRARTRSALSMSVDSTDSDGNVGLQRPAVMTVSWDVPLYNMADRTGAASRLTRLLVAWLRGQETTPSADTPDYTLYFTPFVNNQEL